jgi:hypothetical protein
MYSVKKKKEENTHTQDTGNQKKFIFLTPKK